MTMPVEIVREVRQLDNDVQSIYEMLAEIAATQRRHGNRFTELDTKRVLAKRSGGRRLATLQRRVGGT